MEVQPLVHSQQPRTKATVKSRLKAYKAYGYCTYLKEIDIKSLVHSKDSAEGKVEMLETIVKIRMDILLPLKSKLVQTNDPPWINQQLRVSFTAAKRILFKATGSCTVPLITLIATGKHAVQSSIISRSNI